MVKHMSKLADVLRENSYEALKENIKHNEEVDCSVLEYIYKECKEESLKGKFVYMIIVSNIEDHLIRNYSELRLKEVREAHESSMRSKYGDEVTQSELELPLGVIGDIAREAQELWYRNIDHRDFDVNGHLEELLEAEGFEVDFSIANLPEDKCMTLYWSNDMGGNE